jgi:hypothetical protein
MDKSEYFEVWDTHAVYRPAGEVSLEQAVQLVTSAVAFARVQNIEKLLLDVTGLTGFEMPSAAARCVFVQEWAMFAESRVRIAVVGRPEIIDSQKIGVAVARKFDLIGDIFDSEEEALAWLLGDQTAAPTKTPTQMPTFSSPAQSP